MLALKHFMQTICIVLAIAAPMLSSGCGSIIRSAAGGDIENINIRIAKGEDVNKADRHGWTALIWAAYYGHANVVTRLLDKGAEPDYKTPGEYGAMRRGSTALMVAAYYGFDNVVSALLRHGANKNIRNTAGETALSLAVRYNFTAVAALLDPGRRHLIQVQRANDPSVTIVLNDGSTIGGTVISQNRAVVKIKTKGNAVMTIDKEKIMNYLGQ